MFGGDGGPDALATPTSDERDAAAKRRDARSSDARESEPEAGPSKGEAGGCTPRATFECYDGDVHYFDSCGYRGALKEQCTGGCVGSACVTCDTHATSACDGDDVYWFDSCGKREALKQACANGCVGATCNACSTHASSQCYGGDAYWYDSCGNREGLKQACSGGCSAGVCAASTWRCTNSSTCFCLVTTDSLSYPSLTCTSGGNCCFEYQSTGGPACYCGTHDATTCNAYISAYSASARSACPP